jgi:Protein of unknown function (DUF2948)
MTAALPLPLLHTVMTVATYPDSTPAPVRSDMDLLKLIALDKDDVEVISAHLQDSVLRVGDIVWLPAERRLVLGLNRFDWEAANDDAGYRRRRAVLRFDRVLAVKCRNISRADADAVLNLLAVEFAEEDPPSGSVTLMFSGGPALRLKVECLEVELVDLGPVWPTSICPKHALTAESPRS